jgi:GT2 family glycosyltransferase/tetratricopeptide (TPR) repeat protein/2-polyprenyl-3-methyl-5-hydroxy-6-metoxy-1,4-benzoquinol methylase
MRLQRIAVVYDDSVRPDTAGVYCLRALQALRQAAHVRPLQAHQAIDRCDLVLRIDDGSEQIGPLRRPCAYWAVDTHVDLRRELTFSRSFDVVFAAQKGAVQQLRTHGITRCEWLPLACDPEMHRRLDVEKHWDVAFIGNVNTLHRHHLLESVQRRFPASFVGQAPHTQIADIYSRARIVINYSWGDDLNMRVFEALACGALLITNRLGDPGQAELFTDRTHLVEFRSPDEALDLIDHYLRHNDEREQIAAAGHQEALRAHTYRHRMQQLLDRMEVLMERQEQGDPHRARPPVSGWPARSHGSDYLHWPRPDLLRLVPREAGRVLDVGCAAGVFGETLKKRQACEVVGIESDPRAAAEARTRLDEVLEADVEALPLSDLGQFDAIICGDVLEHLRDPGAVLTRLRGILSPDGVLIASLPNVRHMDVVAGLVEGNWTYAPAGQLDVSHLRFFTRRSAEQLLEEAGFQVGAVRGVPGPGYAGWEQAGRPGQLEAGHLGISGLSPEEAQEFFVDQWLLTATCAPAVDWGVTSIILLTHNELPYTQLCLESIRKHTHLPYELVVVDNGSTDGTVEWLQRQSDVHLVCNPTNLGFAKGVNQGLQAAEGTHLLLLNNDTVVTPGWLRRLLRCLHSGPDVGLVGPLTNYASGPQQVQASYRSPAALDAFAWDLGRHGTRYQEVSRLIGFCMLMKRETVARVGLLDEQFGLGTFEDDDYSWRARRAGHRLLIATDAFVHHFGSRTFIGAGIDSSALLQENTARFRAKWGDGSLQAHFAPVPAEGAPHVASHWRVGQHESGALLLEPGAAQISLCMIVRDEEARIADCLSSIRRHVDEMIVVDTGSTDQTREIARSLGARVIRRQWQDSFSAARNESISHATGEWILWMDADDVIDEESARAIRRCAAQASREVLGFVAQVHCPGGPGEEGETVVDHVKLFRNRPDLRFELRIHEQILPSIRRAGGEIARAPLHVTHANYDRSPEGQRRKRERDQRLLALDLQEHPEHPFVHFNVGMTAFHERDFVRAIEHLRRSIELSAPTDSQVRKAYALLAQAQRSSGDAKAALGTCQEGRRHYPDDPELLFGEALAHQELGSLGAAEQALRTLLAQPARGDYLASIDASIGSCKARHNLGVVLLAAGRPSEAEEVWRQVNAQHPLFTPSWLALGELLRTEGRDQEFQELARRAQRVDGVMGELMQGRAALAEGHPEEAEARLRRALSRRPDLAEACRLLSHALLQQGERREAEEVLRRLLELCPEDGEAHHNLGSVLMETGRHSEAVACYRQSLVHRPGNAATSRMLAQALAQAGASGSTDTPAQTTETASQGTAREAGPESG